MAKTYRFSTRITIIFTTITLISLLIVSIAAMSTAKNALVKRTEDFINASLDSYHRNVTSLFNSAEKSAQAIGDEVLLTLNVSRFLSEDAYRVQYMQSLSGAVQLASQINSSRSAFVVIYNADQSLSTIWYSDDNRDSIPDQKTADEFYNYINLPIILREIPDGQSTFWKIQKTPFNVIVVLIPLEKNGKIIGYSGSEVSFNQLQRNLNDASYLNTGKIWFASSDGLPLLTRSTDAISSLMDPPIEAILKSKAGNFIEYKSHLWTHKTLYNGWLIMSSVTMEDVLEGLTRIQWIILATFVSILVVIFAITSSIAKRIADPYTYLAERIKEIGGGDYQNVIGRDYLGRKDEAGILSNAIASMQRQLQDNFDTISTAKSNLEITVHERTKELVDANHQLEELLSEVRETQKQLALSEKMASLSKVLVGLSHNMNTPLGNAITLITYYEEKLIEIIKLLNEKNLAQAHLKSHLEEGLDIAKHIFDNIQTSRSYIEKIIDISRARQTSQPEMILLKNLATAQYLLAIADVDDNEVALNLDFDKNLSIIASPLYLSEILYELLDNALEHGKIQGQTLTITIKAAFNGTTGILTLDFNDDGRGLKNNEYYEIFTPLVTSQLSNRAGLGLSRVYQIVKDEFSGSITASPNNPSGTCFYLKLYCKKNLL